MSKELEHISSLILLSGLSGGGKSSALDFISDYGFYAIDNLPVALLPNVLQFSSCNPSKYSRTAIMLDIDCEAAIQELLQLLKGYKGKSKSSDKIHLVFLDASKEAIVRRYSETRRPHPYFDAQKDKTLQEAIEKERTLLLPFKDISNVVIDTSNLNRHDLKREIKSFVDSLALHMRKPVRVNFVSFGFKFGIPLDCDLLMDVRFLPNPYFVDTLREKTGLETDVAHYVLSSSEAQEFLTRYSELLNYLLPRYIHEGKSYLNIGIGCTGGKHRSVALAEELAKRVKFDGESSLISVKHRDWERD